MIRLPIQIVTLTTYVIIVIILTYMGRTKKIPILYIIAPLLCVIHGIIFYSFVLVASPIPGVGIATTWSSILRLHIAMTAVGILLAELKYRA